jgi:hypothetical protein
MDDDDLLDRCEACGVQPQRYHGLCRECEEYGPGAGARVAKERHQNLMDMKEHAPKYVDLLARIIVYADKGLKAAAYGSTYGGDHALIEIRTALDEFVRPGYEQPGTTVDAATVAGEVAPVAPVVIDTPVTTASGVTVTCKHCGKQTTAPTRKTRYCSESCFAAARNEQARARRAAKAQPTVAGDDVPATLPVPPSLAESRERAADAVALAEVEAERAPCSTCEVLACAAYREGKAAGSPECQAELKRCGVEMPQIAAMCRECEHRGVCCARGTKAGSKECEEMVGGI